jgi:flagellar M-ring protein FliF
VHLVSSSVPELSPKAVSVVDGNGTLLTQQESPEGALDAQQLQYVQQIESGLQRRIVELLEPVVGRENLRATVTADVDFTESLQVSEQYRPNQGNEPATVKSTQTSESSGSTPGAPSGVPGAQSNQPPVPATAPVNGAAQRLQPTQGGNGASNTRRESSTQYEVDKTQRTTRSATGTVKRLSAAVVVNHRVSVDPKGKSNATPLTEPEIEKLTALVQQGVGFNKDRGDSVRVINAPFRTDATPKLDDIPLWQQPWLQDLLRAAALPAGLGFVALLIVLSVIRPALKTLNATPPPPVPGSQLSAVVDDVNALPEPDAATPLALEAPAPGGDQLERARAMAKQNPAAVANIVRGLMSGEEATT